MFWTSVTSVLRDLNCRASGLRGSIPDKLPTQTKSESPASRRNCPACASPQADPLWQKGGLHLVQCRDCAMVYANPMPVGMASGQFYDDAGKDYYLSAPKLESDYANVRFERELQLFRKCCARGAVLDIGCSSGAFLFQLKQRWPGDYEILGTDVSGAPLDYAEARGVPVLRGNFLELDFDGRDKPTPDPSEEGNKPACAAPLLGGVGGGFSGSEMFDAVTFWAVLEHLAEPRQFLEKAHSILKPGGLCFVLVPNFKSLATRVLGARYRYVYAQHLNYFTAETLARLSAKTFEVVEVQFTHFNPIVIWQDWRDGGKDVSNRERAELLKRTTRYKQSAMMKPVKVLYRATEKILGTLKLADNLAMVLRKR